MSQLEDEIEEVDYSLKVNNQLMKVYKWSMGKPWDTTEDRTFTLWTWERKNNILKAWIILSNFVKIFC